MAYLRTYLRGASPQITEGPRPVPTLSSQKLDAAPVAIGQQPTNTSDIYTNAEYRNIEQSIKTVVEALQSGVRLPPYTTALLPTPATGEYRVAYDTTLGAPSYSNGSAWKTMFPLSDGDKGDITVASNGTTWTIDSGVVNAAKLATDAVETLKIKDLNVTTAKIADDNVTNPKLANMVATRVKARGTASTGDPEDIAIGNGLDLDATSLRTKQQMSITADSSGLKLSGDATSPGNSQYFGTNSGGTKGFFPLVTTYEATTQSATGASVTFTSIPVSKVILVGCQNVSHNNGATQSLRVEVSNDNGFSWSSPVTVSQAVSNAVGIYHYTAITRVGAGLNTLLVGFGIGGSNGGTVVGGIINAVRVSWTAGNHDSGDIGLIAW